MLRRSIRSSVKSLRKWLGEGLELKSQSNDGDDFAYSWLNSLVSKLGEGGLRPSYAWGVLQAANLAKAIGIPRVSVIELGVAGGNGLIALEKIAERVENYFPIAIDVYGFDTGKGLPPPQDYRDLPNLNGEGSFRMDEQKLRRRLRRARLILGDIEDTIVTFINAKPAPIAFIACDLVLYTSTIHALQVLKGSVDLCLPRIHCYFDDVLGFTFGDHNGELLAISEFNAVHAMRKLSRLYGLKYFVPERYANERWVEKFWIAHIFDHPLYGHRDNLVQHHTLALDE